MKPEFKCVVGNVNGREYIVYESYSSFVEFNGILVFIDITTFWIEKTKFGTPAFTVFVQIGNEETGELLMEKEDKYIKDFPTAANRHRFYEDHCIELLKEQLENN